MNIINHLKTKFWTRHVLWCDHAILIYLALAKLFIHLFTGNGYGYQGDELYWQAIAKHLDYGYVDVPPLVAYLAAGSGFLVGTSLFAIHLLPAITGAVMVYLAGLTARELGGGRFAQWFTALMVLTAPLLLTFNSLFTYDPFDQLCTVILFYLAARLINRETPKRWLLIGIVVGLGVMTKLTTIFTSGALVISLLLTARRKSFRTVWPWLAMLIAAFISLPYLVWQWVHGWPLLTYFHNYAGVTSTREHSQLAQFLVKLIFYLNPVILPVLLAGLFYLLFHSVGKKYRILGFTFLMLLVFYAGLAKLEPREMVSGCIPLLIAGAVWLERIIMTGIAKYNSIVCFKWIYVGVILISGALLLPFAVPLLPVPVLEKYLAVTPAPVKNNFYDNVPTTLPFYLSFRVGWPEEVQAVAAVYHDLPEADRKKCVIWGGIFWDAGAIDLLGKEYGLPSAISNCQSYHFWGVDQFSSGKAPEVAIMVRTGFKFPAYDYFEEVSQVGSFNGNKDGIYDPNGFISIYLCRKPKANFLDAWKKNALYW